MLWSLWAEVGNIAFGVFAALGWAIGVMWDWAYLMSKYDWDATNPHWTLFILHVLVAFFGAIWFGKLVYRIEKRLMDAYLAKELEHRWITRRLRREMKQFSKRS